MYTDPVDLQIATQIALAHPKCKVVAIAGAEDKCQKLREMGCHLVLNYKDGDFKDKFRKAGLIDLYFDNGEWGRPCYLEVGAHPSMPVGGEILDLVLSRLQPYARIVACGAISTYNTAKPYRLVNYPALVAMKAKIQGFIVNDHNSRYGEGREYLAKLVREGKMKYDYTILEPRSGEKNGLSRCVEGMQLVSEGKNVGKT